MTPQGLIVPPGPAREKDMGPSGRRDLRRKLPRAIRSGAVSGGGCPPGRPCVPADDDGRAQARADPGGALHAGIERPVDDEERPLDTTDFWQGQARTPAKGPLPPLPGKTLDFISGGNEDGVRLLRKQPDIPRSCPLHEAIPEEAGASGRSGVSSMATAQGPSRGLSCGRQSRRHRPSGQRRCRLRRGLRPDGIGRCRSRHSWARAKPS